MLTKAERFALSNTLSDYPDDVSYQEVQEMLRDYDESVTVWEMMEDWSPEQVIDYQDDLANQVATLLREV